MVDPDKCTCTIQPQTQRLHSVEKPSRACRTSMGRSSSHYVMWCMLRYSFKNNRGIAKARSTTPNGNCILHGIAHTRRGLGAGSGMIRLIRWSSKICEIDEETVFRMSTVYRPFDTYVKMSTTRRPSISSREKDCREPGALPSS